MLIALAVFALLLDLAAQSVVEARRASTLRKATTDVASLLRRAGSGSSLFHLPYLVEYDVGRRVFTGWRCEVEDRAGESRWVSDREVRLEGGVQIVSPAASAKWLVQAGAPTPAQRRAPDEPVRMVVGLGIDAGAPDLQRWIELTSLGETVVRPSEEGRQ